MHLVDHPAADFAQQRRLADGLGRCETLKWTDATPSGIACWQASDHALAGAGAVKSMSSAYSVWSSSEVTRMSARCVAQLDHPASSKGVLIALVVSHSGRPGRGAGFVV